MRNDSVHHDCIRPVDADLCIAGMEDDGCATTHAGRPVRSRLSAEQHPKPERCRPRDGAASCPIVLVVLAPAARLSDAEAAKLAVREYRSAWRNVSPAAKAEHEARMARRAARRAVAKYDAAARRIGIEGRAS